MTTVKVCVGSSCHLKGSYGVIEAFKEILRKYGVEDIVDLQASFCMGYCMKGVSVKAESLEENGEPMPPEDVTTDADGIILHNVNPDNAEDIFAKYVYPRLAK